MIITKSLGKSQHHGLVEFGIEVGEFVILVLQGIDSGDTCWSQGQQEDWSLTPRTKRHLSAGTQEYLLHETPNRPWIR